jgi:hypothetical protein
LTRVEEMAASYVEAICVQFRWFHTNSEAGPWVGVVAYACLEGFTVNCQDNITNAKLFVCVLAHI